MKKFREEKRVDPVRMIYLWTLTINLTKMTFWSLKTDMFQQLQLPSSERYKTKWKQICIVKSNLHQYKDFWSFV